MTNRDWPRHPLFTIGYPVVAIGLSIGLGRLSAWLALGVLFLSLALYDYVLDRPKD